MISMSKNHMSVNFEVDMFLWNKKTQKIVTLSRVLRSAGPEPSVKIIAPYP